VKLALAFVATVLATTSALARSDLSTVAERSGWQHTGRYDEVLRLCDAFAKAYPGRARCEKFGITPEGRAMVAIVVGSKGPTLLVQGGIHAGEIDGKDAGFAVLRDFLDGKLLAPAAPLRLVFVPVFNVDGHERFGPAHRPNQIGPAESGWRTTAQNINLNRDYMKAQAPEMRAMLRLLDKYDPIVYVDLHVTDGAQFRHDVAALVDPTLDALGLDTAVTAAGRGLRDRLMAKLTTQHHLPLGELYPVFVHEDDPDSGFVAYAPPPRFSDAYWALRNRLGVLVETHSWKDYATRVRATRDVVANLIAEVAAHGAEWQKLAHAADAVALTERTIVLATHEDRTRPRMIEFLGYAFKRVQSAISGQFKVTYDPTKPTVWKVPFYDKLLPTVSVTTPRAGYLVPAAWAELTRPILEAHGIQYRRLAAASTLMVHAYVAGEVKLNASSFEGRTQAVVKGSWSPATERDFVAGALFVPLAQPRARVAVALLEPEAPDSLTAWGFHNGVFERKELMEDYVLEDVAEKMLGVPEVKRAFDERLAEDPTFAKSPRARLDFFYRRHPAWDDQLGLIPVFRVDEQP
jgi:hypothetical protein